MELNLLKARIEFRSLIHHRRTDKNFETLMFHSQTLSKH
jgi:hypothetical protein